MTRGDARTSGLLGQAARHERRGRREGSVIGGRLSAELRCARAQAVAPADLAAVSLVCWLGVPASAQGRRAFTQGQDGLRRVS